ncbi:Eco57I restriction-modification methylase domain-containing protein, partial [Escherichia coli]|uniref:Eco57I restriction-modification methylase domain-containing protein n=1 Tax=Escherichia coli TaxID=562 RepID=UPI003C035382
LPKDFFDAAIGNPPFSSTVVSNAAEYKKHGFMLHDYFFAKTLDRVKPGGVVAFVTSKGTMDKASSRAREFMAERANLIGAVRMPQTAFKENAGTEVVTDVLFLQKRGPGIPDNGVKWLGTKEVDTPQGKAPVNEYFADHPEMVLGEHAKTGSMYRADEYTVLPRAGEDIE